MNSHQTLSDSAPTLVKGQQPQQAVHQGWPQTEAPPPQMPEGWMQTPQATPQPAQGYPPHQQSWRQNPPQPGQGYPPHLQSWQQAPQGGQQTGQPGQAGYTQQQRIAWIAVAVLLAWFTLSGKHAQTAPAPTTPGAPTQQAPDAGQVMTAVAQPITQFIDGVQNGNANQALAAWDEGRRAQQATTVQMITNNAQQNGIVYNNRNINIQVPPTAGRCVAVVTFVAQSPAGANPVRQVYTLVQRGDQWFIDRLD